LTSAVPPHRDEVATAGRLLVEVESILRSRGAVYAQGVAMLERLLTDAASPLYSPPHRGALAEELEMVISSLEGQPPRS
jgi:hypothetical protein